MQYMGNAGLSRAYMELSPGILAHNAPARTTHIDKLVGILLAHCEIDDWDRGKENAKVLCLAALAWDDPELWCKTAKKCRNFIELPDGSRGLELRQVIRKAHLMAFAITVVMIVVLPSQSGMSFESDNSLAISSRAYALLIPVILPST